MDTIVCEPVQLRPSTTITFNSQELTTILAALIYYWEEGMGEPSERSNHIHDMATAFDQEISLDGDGIFELFERIRSCSTAEQ